MWIQHPELGAISIVLADDLETGEPDPAHLMIRARRREHLRLLQERCGGLARAEIIETVSTDYRWRIVVEKSALATALAEIAQDISYRNVKVEAHANVKTLGEGFLDALHRIWTVLRELQ